VSSSTIDGAAYTYDSAGNRTAKTNEKTAVTSNYTYDPLYELTQVTQATNTTESYSYDPVGNRTFKTLFQATLTAILAARSVYLACPFLDGFNERESMAGRY
jgi:YD repeat-containing protein